MTGVVFFVASIIRLSQYSAVWLYCGFAVKYYHAVRQLPVLRGAAYNSNIYPSHMFNFALVIWCALYLPYAFIALGAARTFIEEGALLIELISGLIDFNHALFMLVAARLQVTYLPEHSGHGNCSEAYNWGVSNGELSFFTLISISVDNGNMTYSGATEQCVVYEAAWLVEKIMGYIAIVTGSMSLVYPIYRLLRPIVSFLVRYVRTKQSYRRAVHNRGSLMPLSQIAPPIMEQVEIPHGEKPTLLNLVKKPSIVNLIASYSHYTDMKSLQLTCKVTRAAMKSETLMRDSCIKGTKSECLGCMIQVCETCQTSKPLLAPATSVHLEKCQPYCSRCHLKLQYASEGDPWRSKYCECKAGTQGSWRTFEKKNQVLCRFCAALPDDEIRLMREKREKAEMDHLLQWPLRCAKCNGYLDGKSQCWWGCMLCYGACSWDGHPSRAEQFDQ